MFLWNYLIHSIFHINISKSILVSMLTMIQHCINLKQFKFTYSIVIVFNYWNSVILVME